MRIPRNEYGICAHFISPLCASTTWNSWMRSRFSASDTSSSSASPRVPTSEKLCSRCPSAKSSHAAANSRLSCARRSPSRRRHAGSSFRNVYLTKRRALTPSIIAPAGLAGPIGRGAPARPRWIQYESVRIALLSPYSWTYPGGVTRHLEALAGELACERPRTAHPRAVRSRRRALAAAAPRRAPPAALRGGGLRLARAHRRPVRQRRRLERGAQLPRHPHRAAGVAPRRLRRGAHPRAGRAHRRLGRSLQRRRAAARGHLPHLLRERPHQRHRRHPARRPAPDEPPARAHRRLRGRRVDRAALLRRALSRHPQRRPPPGRRRARVRAHGRRSTGRGSRAPAASAADPVHRSGGRSARACRFCCRRSKRCATRSRRRSRSSVPAHRRSPT